ncbi:MAG: hypothetical protein QXU18_00295 [Thermoplasmatales archaeon]
MKNYTGTQVYHRNMGLNLTDGVKYVMDNGYAWLVTDAAAIVIMEPKVKAEDFVAIDLKPGNGNADVVYTDGNGHELFRQHYDWTDAKKEVTLYFSRLDLVMLLPTEY